jgi:hypothetical protein
LFLGQNLCKLYYMKHITLKTLLLTTLFFSVFLYTTPSFCETDPYVDKIKLKSAVGNIISAIKVRDIDSLTELSKLPGSFQYDKKRYIRNILRKYSNKTLATAAIEVKSMDINGKEKKAEVKVIIHLVAVNTTNDPVTEPRHEVWNFVKGEKSSQRGEWIFVLK